MDTVSIDLCESQRQVAPARPTIRSNICPALAAAGEIARLEAGLVLACRRIDAAPHNSPDIDRLGAEYEALILAAEDARARLAEVEATSVAGAAAQLLAAIRDIRMRDDVERARAGLLEERALAFLGAAEILGRETAQGISRTTWRA